MKIPCVCAACGFVNDADWSQIGQWIACRGCGRTLVVPAPMETAEVGETPRSVVKFRCPACNRKFATKAELAGKKIRCTGCGAGVRVPETDPIYWSSDDAQAPPQGARTRGPEVAAPIQATNDGAEPTRGRAPDRIASAYSRPDDVPAPPQPPRGRPPGPAGARAGPADEMDRSPSALDELASLDGIKAPRRAGTVLTSRAELMDQVRQQAAEAAASAEEKSERTKRKKKKKKKSGYFDAMETLKLVAGVGALVVVLALVAWGYPDFRFPVGGFLCVVGFVVYLLGVTSLRQHVAEEGPFKALVFRFFPPYQWWYVATRWSETKDFVAFFGAGVLILSIGSAVIKTSPVGKKAEAADRALEKKERVEPREFAPPSPADGRGRNGIRSDTPPSSPHADHDDD